MRSFFCFLSCFEPATLGVADRELRRLDIVGHFLRVGGGHYRVCRKALLKNVCERNLRRRNATFFCEIGDARLSRKVFGIAIGRKTSTTRRAFGEGAVAERRPSE